MALRGVVRKVETLLRCLAGRCPTTAERRRVSIVTGRRGGVQGLKFRFGLADAIGHDEDAVIDDDHDKQRKIESADRGVELVGYVLTQFAMVWGWGCPPPKQRGYADEGGQNPNADDHQSHSTGSPFGGVNEWASDGQVPVDADGTQVEDAGRAQEHVGGRPNVTEDFAELPDAHDLMFWIITCF